MIRFKEEKTKIPKEIRYLVEDVINAIPDDCFDFLGNVETDMTRSLKGIADNSKMFDAYLELNNLTQLGVTAQYMLHNAQDINRMLDSNLANRCSHLNKKDFLILTNKLNKLIGKLKDMPNFKRIKRLGESKTRHSNILERSKKKYRKESLSRKRHFESIENDVYCIVDDYTCEVCKTLDDAYERCDEWAESVFGDDGKGEYTIKIYKVKEGTQLGDKYHKDWLAVPGKMFGNWDYDFDLEDDSELVDEVEYEQ